MATYASILVPSSPTAVTLFSGTATTNSTPLTIGYHAIIGIVAAGATAGNVVNVRFGNALKAPNATAADWAIPVGTMQLFDLGQEFDRIAIYSAGTTVSYWVYVFSVH